MVLVEKDVISTPLLVIDNRTDFSKYLKLMFIHLIIPPNTFDFNYTLKKLIIEVPNKHRVVVEFKPKMILPHNMYVQLLFKEYLDVNYAREIVESIYKEYHKKLNITFKQVVDLSLNSVYVYIFADWFRSIPIEYGIMYKNVLEGSFLNLISYVKQKYRIVLNRTINLRFNITPVFMDPLSHIRYVTIDLNNTYSIIDYENKCFRALSFIIKTSYKNTFINIGVKMNNAIYLFSYNYYKWIPSMLLKLDRYALYYKEMENTIFYILDSSNILRNFVTHLTQLYLGIHSYMKYRSIMEGPLE